MHFLYQANNLNIYLLMAKFDTHAKIFGWRMIQPDYYELSTLVALPNL